MKKYNVRSIMHRTACTIVNGEQKFPPQFLNRICQKRTSTNGTVKNRIAKTAGLINFFQSVFKAFSTPRRRDSSAYSRTRKRDAIPRTQYETFKQKTHFSWQKFFFFFFTRLIPYVSVNIDLSLRKYRCSRGYCLQTFQYKAEFLSNRTYACIRSPGTKYRRFLHCVIAQMIIIRVTMLRQRQFVPHPSLNKLFLQAFSK